RAVGDVPGAFARVERAPGRAGFALALADGRRVDVPLPQAGRHMAENAACALVLADWCGAPLEDAAARLGAFAGSGRRTGAPGRAGFALALADGRRVDVPLPQAGRHMAENAACALVLADWCGAPLEDAAARLAAFAGIGRRMEPRGRAAGVEVVDDYAHHPA